MTKSQPYSTTGSEITSTGSDQQDSQLAPAHLPDGSIERIQELRTRLARHEATATRRRDELSSELARQESIWSAKEAQRLSEEQLNVANTDYETAWSVYCQHAAAAASSFEELHSIACSAAIVVRAAVRAEQAKRDAQPALESAWRRLHELRKDLPELMIAASHDFGFGPYDPRRGVLLAGLLVYPEARKRLTQLAPEDCTPTGDSTTPIDRHSTKVSAEPHLEYTDQLDDIFRRAQAKREQDDQRCAASDRDDHGRDSGTPLVSRVTDRRSA